MGNHYTRIVRVYARTESSKIDKDAISAAIIDSAYLEYELHVFENKEEQCLDLKWTSNRAGGDLRLDNNEFDIWEIRGGDYNNIYFNEQIIGGKEDNANLFFAFDSIRLKGNVRELDELFNDIYTTDVKENWIGEQVSKDTIRIPVKGIYSTGIRYDLGEYDINNQNAIRHLNKKDFLQLNGEHNSTYDCLMSNSVVSNLIEVLEKFELAERSYDDDLVNVYPHLQSLEFMWKNRVVNKISRTESLNRWSYQNSDWWDNCICPEWIEYRSRRNYVVSS